MYDPGTSTSHSNAYDHGRAADFDSLTKVSWACFVHIKSGATWSANRFIWGKTNASTAAGFYLRTSGSGTRGELRAIVHTGAAVSNVDAGTTIDDDTTVGVFCRHDGDADLLTIDLEGLGQAENSSATNDPGDGDEITICDSSGGGAGAAVVVGQCVIWPEYIPTDAEVLQFFAGKTLPAAAKAGFWDKCTVEPGVDLIGGGTASEVNTITLFSDDVDGYFSGQGFLLPHRQLAGHSIRVLSTSPELYRFVVPAEYAALSLGDGVLINHGDLPAAASLLSSLDEHFMLEDFRGLNGFILEANIESDNQLSITVLNRLPSMAFFWNTAALDAGQLINSNEEGTAAIIPWAEMTNSRNSQHFLVDATDESDRARLGSIARFASKINHLGTLYEPAVENLVQNSAFLIDGAGPPTFADTTESLGTGGSVNAVTSSTIAMLFADETILGNDIQAAEIVKGSAGDVTLEWDLAIDTSGDDARVLFWHRGDAGNYAIQRTSDSNYWVSGTTWQASINWHDAPASSDEWVREITDVIQSVPTSGSLKLIVGIESGTGLENDKIYLGQMMAYQYWAILSDIVTLDGATETSEVDDEVWDLDNGGTHSAQTFNPNRGTVRVRLRFETDPADIPNSTVMTICMFGVTTTDYDHFFLEKTAGGTFRLAAERVISGAQDAIATKTLASYSRGNELEVAMRWTDTRGEELGLSARTISVFEEGTKGTDDQASGIHSTSDQTTFLRWGNPDTSVSVEPLTVCYAKNVELVQWTIPDESIQARRIAA